MTSPNVVGSASVEILAELKGFAKGLRKQVEDEFKGLDFGKLIRDSVGSQKVSVPVEPDVDTSAIPAKVRGTQAPKVPVELDPVVAAFQQEVRRQTAALARQVAVHVPIEADAGGLRATLGAELASVQSQLKIQVPTEPGAKAAYEAKLKADLAAVAARVKQTVKVDVDTGKGNPFAGLANATKSLPGIGSVASGLADIVGAMQKVTATSAQMGGSLAGAFTSATGPIGLVVGALVAVAGAAAIGFGGIAAGVALAIPAIAALAGAIAALPGLLAGIGAGVGTLALGFKGITEAFKPKSGGGGGGAGSVVNQARQIAAASRQVEAAKRGVAAANRQVEASERSLAAAQRGVLAAQRAYADSLKSLESAQKKAASSQEAVNRARREAVEDIDDLGRALRGAVISEAEAGAAVDDALFALNEAKLGGDLKEIRKAQNAYDRAVLSLEDAKDSTEELKLQSDEAAKKGVEGSDKVQAALQDQAESYDAVRQAQQGVIDGKAGILDAADALKSAQDGVLSAQDGVKSAADGLASAMDSLAQAQQKVAAGGGGVAKEVIKLAPAAQKFVDAVKSLKFAFEDLRLDVQERLFKNLDSTVTNVGRAWIPALKKTLGSYADTFNQFFHNLGASITTPKFISDIQAGAEGARQGLKSIGDSITTSLVPAFGSLSKAAAPFLKAFGDEIADIVTDFSNWVLQGEKTGDLEDFFDRATEALHDVFTTGKLVFKIVGDVIGILTGSQDKGGQDSPIDSFNRGLEKLHNWLNDSSNQQKIRDTIADVKDAVVQFGKFADRINGFFSDTDDGPAEAAGKAIGSALVAGILSGAWEALKTSVTSWLTWFGPLGPIVGSIKQALGIQSPSTVMAEVGRNLIEGLISGVGEWLGSLGDKVAQIKTTVVGKVKDAGSWLVNAGRSAVSGMVNGVGQWLGQLKTRAGQLKTTVVNAMSTANSWLISAGRNAVSGLMSGIGSWAGNLRTRAASLRTTVVNALSNAGTWLRTTGVNVVIGLWNGLASMGSWLWNKVVNFARTYVRDAINNALSVFSPSRVTMETGRYVGIGLALGIESQADRVKKAADEVAAAAVPQVNDAALNLGADMDAAVQASLRVADPKAMTIGWRNGANSDPLLRALQDVIYVSFNNDPVAALSK